MDSFKQTWFNSFMKKFILIISLALSFNALASVSIVSDLDDTIKITNSDDTVDGAINAALKSDVFTGITDFFKGTKTYVNELHVLSASPGILRGKIQATLKKRQIEYTSIILKNPAARETKFDYKVKAIKAIMEKNPDDFILIGDDVGQDPEAYGEIQRLNPNRVLAIYIHVIKNRAIPAGVPYWTSFDLFLREFVAGRMTPGWVEQGLKTLLAEKNPEKIIPDFAHCPKADQVWSWQWGTMYAEEAVTLTSRLLENCQARRSSILALQ